MEFPELDSAFWGTSEDEIEAVVGYWALGTLHSGLGFVWRFV